MNLKRRSSAMCSLFSSLWNGVWCMCLIAFFFVSFMICLFPFFIFHKQTISTFDCHWKKEEVDSRKKQHKIIVKSWYWFRALDNRSKLIRSLPSYECQINCMTLMKLIHPKDANAFWRWLCLLVGWLVVVCWAIWGEKWSQAHTRTERWNGPLNRTLHNNRWMTDLNWVFNVNVWVCKSASAALLFSSLRFVAVDYGFFCVSNKIVISTVKQAKHFKEDALNFQTTPL